MNRVLLLLLIFSLSACKDVTVKENFHFVYLNWASVDTSSTMQVNVATTKKVKNWQLHVREEGRGHFVGTPVKLQSNKHLKNAFYIHHELVHLKPGKEYEFFFTADEYTGPVYKFRSIRKNQEEIRFIVGGDTGAGKRFAKMSEIAHQYDFDFAIFGGDIAYANGDLENYKSWVKWLEIWTKASTKGNRLLPFIVAIGNHEINYLHYFGSKLAKAPFYFGLFQQDKRSYFLREIAGQRFLILDTGHATSYSSQKEFIQENLVNNEEQFQFAFYHIPFFPGHRSFKGQASQGRKAWMNLFEEKNLDIAFEHHDHVLKRTYPLRNLEVSNENGIVYLGDGAMGKGTRDLNNEWYLERAQSENHFWYVELQRKRAKFSAIGLENQVLDQFELNK